MTLFFILLIAERHFLRFRKKSCRAVNNRQTGWYFAMKYIVFIIFNMNSRPFHFAILDLFSTVSQLLDFLNFKIYWQKDLVFSNSRYFIKDNSNKFNYWFTLLVCTNHKLFYRWGTHLYLWLCLSIHLRVSLFVPSFVRV